MTPGNLRNVAASVRARLTELAKKQKEDLQALLTRYAIERFLFRLSVSPHNERFVLKGAMLFQLWTQLPHRATKDVDLMGIGESSLGGIAEVMKAICSTTVPDDGLTFETAALVAERIKEDQEYEGVRVLCPVRLGSIQLRLQIDVGFGDAISPHPESVNFPTLLDFPAPILQAYPKESVVAEKFHAMVLLGLPNSRMKDFFDLWILCKDFAFEGESLTQAIRATFQRRGLSLPSDTPLALTAEFGTDPSKTRQWAAFIRKGKLAAVPENLTTVIDLLEQFLMPVARMAAENDSLTAKWMAGGPWVNSTKAQNDQEIKDRIK